MLHPKISQISYCGHRFTCCGGLYSLKPPQHSATMPLAHDATDNISQQILRPGHRQKPIEQQPAERSHTECQQQPAGHGLAAPEAHTERDEYEDGGEHANELGEDGVAPAPGKKTGGAGKVGSDVQRRFPVRRRGGAREPRRFTRGRVGEPTPVHPRRLA